jgi:hypothetical protein
MDEPTDCPNLNASRLSSSAPQSPAPGVEQAKAEAALFSTTVISDSLNMGQCPHGNAVTWHFDFSTEVRVQLRLFCRSFPRRARKIVLHVSQNALSRGMVMVPEEIPTGQAGAATHPPNPASVPLANRACINEIDQILLSV